jgi:endonuclease YncB( thermonuclease family)
MPADGRYVVLTGKFQIRNEAGGQQPRPDGDTIKFVVDDQDLVRNLPRFEGVAPKINRSGGINLRLEVIDALETHYPTDKGRGREVHQQLDLAFAARDKLLELLGFADVEFNPDSTVKSAEAFSVAGFILANGIEGNGRVVGFAYAGDSPPKPNGQRIRLDAPLMEDSANIKLLEQGLAYATLYKTLPFELILHSREITRVARESELGVFGAEDVGVSKSAKIEDISALQKLVLMPKLFRRLADFLVITGDSLLEFDRWVREDERRDDPLILPSGEVGNLHDLYAIDGERLKLNFNPEDIQVIK